MSTIKKAVVLSREMASRLAVRFAEAGLVVVQGTDTANTEGLAGANIPWPTITVSDGAIAAGDQTAFVRVKAMASLGTDGVGMPERSFGPHIAQVVLEQLTTAGNAAVQAGNTFVTAANLTRLMSVLSTFGVRVELYVSTTGAAPTVAGITGAPDVVITDLYWKNLADV